MFFCEKVVCVEGSVLINNFRNCSNLQIYCNFVDFFGSVYYEVGLLGVCPGGKFAAIIVY